MWTLLKKVFFDEQTARTVLSDLFFGLGVLATSSIGQHLIGDGGIIGAAVSLLSYSYSNAQRYTQVPTTGDK